MFLNKLIVTDKMKKNIFILFCFIWILQAKIFAVNDTIQVSYYSATAGEFGGRSRQITIFKKDSLITFRFVEFNGSINSNKPHNYSMEKWMSNYYNNNKDYFTIVENDYINQSQYIDFMKVVENIINYNIELGVSNGSYYYYIKNNKDEFYLTDWKKERYFDRELENALNLHENYFFIRSITSDKPNLYALSSMKMPYDMIKKLLSNKNIVRIKFDKDYSTEEYSGIHYIHTNQLIVLDDIPLTTERIRRKKLSEMDYLNCEIIKLNKKDAKQQFGNKGKNGAIIIKVVRSQR